MSVLSPFRSLAVTRRKITTTSGRVVHRANAGLHGGAVLELREKEHPPKSSGTPAGHDKVSTTTSAATPVYCGQLQKLRMKRGEIREFENRWEWKRDGHGSRHCCHPFRTPERACSTAREWDSKCGCAASANVAAAALPALLRLKNIIFNLNFYLVGHTIAQHVGRHRIILGFSTQKTNGLRFFNNCLLYNMIVHLIRLCFGHFHNFRCDKIQFYFMHIFIVSNNYAFNSVIHMKLVQSPRFCIFKFKLR